MEFYNSIPRFAENREYSKYEKQPPQAEAVKKIFCILHDMDIYLINVT